MEPDLLRQRRNLIAVSCVLLVFDFARVSIGKVNVLGTELLVGDARVLTACAWIAWAYLFLRYYQYWAADKGRSRSLVAYRETLQRLMLNFAKAKFGRQFTGSENYSVKRNGLGCELFEASYQPGLGGMKNETVGRVSAARVGLWGLRAACRVAIQTPHATDHILPFAVAIAAPVVAVVSLYGNRAQFFLDGMLSRP